MLSILVRIGGGMMRAVESDERAAMIALRAEGLSTREIARRCYRHVDTVRFVIVQDAQALANHRRGKVSDKPRRAAALRDRGFSYRSIAEEVGYSCEASAQRAVREWRARQAAER